MPGVVRIRVRGSLRVQVSNNTSDKNASFFFVHNPPQAHRTIFHGTSTAVEPRFATGTRQNNPNGAPTAEPAGRERRRLAVPGMSLRRNRPPPALRSTPPDHPPVPFRRPQGRPQGTKAGRRVSIAALQNAMSVIAPVSPIHRSRQSPKEQKTGPFGAADLQGHDTPWHF